MSIPVILMDFFTREEIRLVQLPSVPRVDELVSADRKGWRVREVWHVANKGVHVFLEPLGDGFPGACPPGLAEMSCKFGPQR